jgi:hypothetical protein
VRPDSVVTDDEDGEKDLTFSGMCVRPLGPMLSSGVEDVVLDLETSGICVIRGPMRRRKSVL